jgi:hypothetical protein
MGSGTELLQMMLQKRAADQELEIANRQMDLDEKNSRWNRLFTGVNTLANVANTGFDAAGKFTELRDNYRKLNPFDTDTEKRTRNEAEAAQADLQTQLDALSQQATADQHMNPALREQYLNEQVGNLEGQRAEEIAGLERDYVGAFNQLDQGNVETPDTAMAPDFSTMPTDLSRDIDSANRDVEQFNQGMIERDARMMSADRDQQSLADAIAEQQAIIEANRPRSQNERDEAERLRLLEETQTREDEVAARDNAYDMALQDDQQTFQSEENRLQRINALEQTRIATAPQIMQETRLRSQYISDTIAPDLDPTAAALLSMQDVLTSEEMLNSTNVYDELGNVIGIQNIEGIQDKLLETINNNEVAAINRLDLLAQNFGYATEGENAEWYMTNRAKIEDAYTRAREMVGDVELLQEQLENFADMQNQTLRGIKDEWLGTLGVPVDQLPRVITASNSVVPAWDLAVTMYTLDPESFNQIYENPETDPMLLRQMDRVIAGGEDSIAIFMRKFQEPADRQLLITLSKRNITDYYQRLAWGRNVETRTPTPNPIEAGNREAQELRSLEQVLEEQRRMEEERRRREEEAIDPWLRNINY